MQSSWLSFPNTFCAAVVVFLYCFISPFRSPDSGALEAATIQSWADKVKGTPPAPKTSSPPLKDSCEDEVKAEPANDGDARTDAKEAVAGEIDERLIHGASDENGADL